VPLWTRGCKNSGLASERVLDAMQWHERCEVHVSDDEEEYTYTGTGTGTGTGVLAEGAENAPPVVDEEPTAPHDLAKIAAKRAKERRRRQIAELTVKRPKAAEVRIALDRDVTVIGRDPACDIIVQSVDVSRRHARVMKLQSGYFQLEDARSRNGTRVEGVGIKRMTLVDGDTFQVGDTRFTVRISEDEG
jgi:hypothetical protein